MNKVAAIRQGLAEVEKNLTEAGKWNDECAAKMKNALSFLEEGLTSSAQDKLAELEEILTSG